MEREDSVISGLTTEGDEVPHSIKDIERPAEEGNESGLDPEEVKEGSWDTEDPRPMESALLKGLKFELSLDSQRSRESAPTPASPNVLDWWNEAGTPTEANELPSRKSMLGQAESIHQYGRSSEQSELSRFSDQDGELARELTYEEVRVDAMEPRCPDAMLRIADLESENAEISAHMHAAEQQLQQGMAELAQQRSDNEQELQQHCKEQQVFIGELKSTIEEQECAAQILQEEKLALLEAAGANKGLEGTCGKLQGELEELEAAMRSQEAELHALEQENLQLQGQLQASDEACGVFRSSVGELQREMAGLDASASDLRRTLRGHVASEQSLRTELEELQAQLEAMQEEKQAVLDAHVAEMEVQSGQYADLAAKLRRAEALISAQEHQLTAAQEQNLETKRKLSRSEEELAVALQQVIAGKHDADTVRSIATDTYEPTDRESKLATLEERWTALEAQKAEGEARLASLQQEADDALDMAEKATAGLQHQLVLLGSERDELKAALASQVAAAAEGTRRLEALEQEMEDATKKVAQAATEQAARALAMYAAEAASLREQLAEAQASQDAPGSARAGMGTLHKRNASLLTSGGLSYTRTMALQEEVEAKRAEVAQLKAQLMMEQVVAADPGWQRHGHDDAELLIRETEELRRELDAVKAQNAELQAAIQESSHFKDIAGSQPLERKLASYEGDGWLEQCCASLAEQLRVAQAENVELQKTVEELRGDSSGQSSPMAWDGTRTSSGHFESALEMETSSQGSRQSRARTNSWTSQRSLEAQIATLRQQLDISAATEVELQREIDLLRKEGGAEAVASAVAVAVAARDSELGAMQRHMAELEDALHRALAEAAEAQEESLDMRNACVHLDAALRDSEAKRGAMQQEKHMLEAQLLQTAGEVATAERELTGSQLSSLASAQSSSMAYSSDSDDSDGTASAGGSPLPRSHIGRLAEASTREVESLRAENDAIMKELVEKKMELAELHEELIKMSHAHAHAQHDSPKKT
ncbi:hypothetical protein COCSUDRAFT_62022 [Coccomyxa subellipsoidea C-169]|uniref:Uncharacterized protein n=1 Tax=Coccomyxa subellipsoidea (strain C-169) TaxID=574566 RepID=I0Z1S2_COCSC|nr:hypothetical protein COCSUDRAFT_62022 [Coccomyxa subellipsoidea C-169]EIE24591.1 hypothetical protein COCSUDRAFT_62022 [Coccomyxa subellipsoidea C-169]|eukprot:XP_005649135.1 hypothetical protein COCSUDRAFT_62022 [Coccomyxa subellipsoidea C-169]